MESIGGCLFQLAQLLLLLMNECVIVLMCDVSKLITEERRTHSNIRGRTPEHEIIIHHWCIIISSVSTKAARRCAEDFKG
jgi:hypothetical protein